MHRTQIYLSENEMIYLRNLSRIKKKTLSELIREAIDKFYVIGKKQKLSQAIDVVFGIWADRRDMPKTKQYLRALRKSKRLDRILK